MSHQQIKKRKAEEFIRETALSNLRYWTLPDLDLNKSSFQTECMKPSIKIQQQNIQTIDLEAQPILQGSFASLENVVSGADGRKKIDKTEEWPSSIHGVVSTTTNGVSAWGSGTLFLPSFVLTAAHNLYSREKKAFVDMVEFLPAMNGYSLPFGKIKVIKYFVSQEYVKAGKSDYAVLMLEDPIGLQTGYFGLSILDSKELMSKTINITGYPSDKVKDKPKIYEMWGMGGKVSNIKNNNMMEYLIDTAAGQSGSGIWYEEDGKFYIVGVHAQGCQIVNEGVLLTKQHYGNICEWIKESMREEVEKKSKSYIYSLNFQKNQNQRAQIEMISVYELINLRTISAFDFNIKVLAKNTTGTPSQQIYFSSNNLGDVGAKILAKNTTWTHLQQINLWGNNIGDIGAEALAKNTTWAHIQQINLSWNRIGDRGAEALAKNTTWTHLQQIDLSTNKIGDRGAEALARTTWIRLQQIDLHLNNIGERGAKALAKNTTWTHLQQINLWGNNIGDAGAEALAKNTTWTHLQQINLWGNNIGDVGAGALAKNTTWTHLQQIDLSTNEIGDIGAEALAKNTTWIHLQQIDLSTNEIGERGAEALAKNTTWTYLSKIRLPEIIFQNFDKTKFPRLEFVNTGDSSMSFGYEQNISLNDDEEEERALKPIAQIESNNLAASDNFYRNDESSYFPLEIFQAEPANGDLTCTTFQNLSMNTNNNCDVEFPSLPIESATSNDLEHSPR